MAASSGAPETNNPRNGPDSGSPGSSPAGSPARSGADTPLAAVVLAAGYGRRLDPLTRERPKALCPVGRVPLIDHALERLESVAHHLSGVAVNAHHRAADLARHLEGATVSGVRPDPGVHLSVERHAPLGTAGALVRLRHWLDGRGALVVNADALTTADLGALLDGWDGATPRVLVARPPALHQADPHPGFTPQALVAGALVGAADVARFPDGPSGLFEVCWGPAHEAGTLEVVCSDETLTDCGTPAAYLAANIAAAGGASLFDDGAVIQGTVRRSLVWPDAVVHPGENLVDAIRTTAGRTVLVRNLGPR
jgi:CTP:molybdopterin cytidylyltransferase MocA